MALPEGAHYVRGSGRKLVTLADGSVVKRQAAENIEAQARNIPGIGSLYDLRKLRSFGKTDRGRKALQKFRARDSEAVKNLQQRGDIRARPEREVEDLALAVAKEHAAGALDKSPGGPLAQYLTAIGYRNPGADYSVGDTPNAK